MYSGSLLRPVMRGNMWSGVMCTTPHPSYFNLSLLAFPRNTPRWSTPRKFLCSQISQKQILDNVYGQFSFTFLWSTPPISCLYNVNCYYLFRLINYENRIKIFVCIRHMSLATFTTFKIVATRPTYLMDFIGVKFFS
jgi:hypothetical protein